MLALRCPLCQRGTLGVNPRGDARDPLPRNGEAICAACYARFTIRDHILNLAIGDAGRALTVAGMSNYLPPLPFGYEHLWRPRALSLLSGEKFPVARELEWLNSTLAPKPAELIVDLGSSTDLYARGIGQTAPHAHLVAIDIAPGMLRYGRVCAQPDQVHNIAHVRANVERLPFHDASVDALVCGGSLNEFRSMRVALDEAARVCKPGGRLVAMSLLAATRPPGKIAQAQAKLSGITFPSHDEFNATLAATGWRCVEQNVIGIVAFTLVKK